LSAAIWEIIADAASKGALDRRFGILLQAFRDSDFHGHLSNEVRLSAAIEKWVYEVDLPSEVVRRRLKIVGQRVPSESEPVRIRDPWNVSAPLAQVASWLTERIKGRCHVEWCTAGTTCWILQLDEEHDLDDGDDPRQALREIITEGPHDLSLRVLSAYHAGQTTNWSKLRNISDFNLEHAPAKHRLFYLEGSRRARVKEEHHDLGLLEHELHAITTNNLVVRIDTNPPQENLPRTDSYQPECAFRWILDYHRHLVDQRLDVQDFCFIVHVFIPALAAAWTYI
jgi:hypothetical protein